MSRWHDQFKAHQIHSLIGELRDTLPEELKTSEESEPEERRRFLKVLSEIENTLSHLDPEIVPFNQLDNLQNHLRQHALPLLNQYKAQGNLGGLRQANDHISQQLTQVAVLRATEAYSQPAPEIYDLEGQFDQITAALVEKKSKSEGKLAELERKIDSNVGALRELTDKLEKLKSEADQRISEWQQQFSQSQESRNQQFTEWLQDADREAKERISGIVDASANEIEIKRKEASSELDELIRDSAERHKQIRELHQLAAEDSVAGGYVSNANDEGRAAVRWRRGSIGFILTAAAWLIYGFFTRADSFSWETALLTLPVTAVLLAGAAYCAQQSTRHRTVEERNRRFALEMSAIDPYLQSLPEEDQREIKKQLTSRFFGNAEEGVLGEAVDEKQLRRILDLFSSRIFTPASDLARLIKQQE